LVSESLNPTVVVTLGYLGLISKIEFDTLSPKLIGLSSSSIASLRRIPVSVVFAALVLLASVYLPRFKYKSHLAQFPLILEHLSSEERRAKFLAGAKALYKDGHHKVSYSVRNFYSTNMLLVQGLGL
jgi:hypothetical protein